MTRVTASHIRSARSSFAASGDADAIRLLNDHFDRPHYTDPRPLTHIPIARWQRW